MTEPDEIPAAPAAPAPAPRSLGEVGRFAKILTRDTVKARGFTLGKGQTVDRVPLAHAEYLVSKGQAEILEVS